LSNPFENFLKTALNSSQKKAVAQKKGAIIVIAGAGSGKTRVITARMTNLILNQGVEPRQVIALTFTNKAAGEMKARLMRFLGARQHLPFVGTFHSYCLLLLRTNPGVLPFTDFSILDEDDKKTLLKKLIKQSGLEKQFSASQLARQISMVKNQVKSDDETFSNPLFKELLLAYEAEKGRAHSLDFDDLLIAVLKIFEKNKAFKEKFQKQIRHVLVDEYQDTNGVQHALLKQIGLNSKKKFVLDSLCVVGDEDQSIYSWRGALIANMLSFKNDFAPVKTIKIEQNYRSVQPILKAANKVIENNTKRHPKELWSDRKARNRILALTCQSGYSEAETIATYLKSLPQKTKLRDVAILYRTHFQSRNIEEALIRDSIPYTIVGGIRFYERKEIKDLIAYLRLIMNPFDRASLFRILNTPARGLGAKFEEQLYTEWNKDPLLDFRQMLEHLLKDKKQKITGVKAEAIKKFLSFFATVDKALKPTVILENLLEKTEYFSYLRKAYDENDAQTKIENIQEFAQSIAMFEKKVTGDKPTLENFLFDIALLQEKLEGKDEHADHVQMMTLHAAKGLEFNTIMVTGLEEGLLPSTRSLHSDDAVEEERRLFYVGMTRAKERLVLLRATYRNTYGQIMDAVVSRFLTEVPSRLLHHIDLTQVHPAQGKRLLADWLGTQVAPSIKTFGQIKPKKLIKTAGKKVAAKKNSFSQFKLKPATTPKVATKLPVPTGSPWRKNHPVQHKVFGTGIIKKVESAPESKYYLTVQFRTGQKRILSDFVKTV